MSEASTVYRLARLSPRERMRENSEESLAFTNIVLDGEGRAMSYVVTVVADRDWAAPDWDISIRWCAALSHESLHIVFCEMGVDPEGQLDGFCMDFDENGDGTTPPIGLTGLPRAME